MVLRHRLEPGRDGPDLRVPHHQVVDATRVPHRRARGRSPWSDPGVGACDSRWAIRRHSSDDEPLVDDASTPSDLSELLQPR